MNNLPDILKYLRSNEAAGKFQELYGKREGVLLYQMERYSRIAKRFSEEFGTVEGVSFFSAPGRTEIGGNHTDHQAGRVLAAGVNLDTVAIAAPTVYAHTAFSKAMGCTPRTMPSTSTPLSFTNCAIESRSVKPYCLRTPSILPILLSYPSNFAIVVLPPYSFLGSMYLTASAYLP